jgi:hypothetical protein
MAARSLIPCLTDIVEAVERVGEVLDAETEWVTSPKMHDAAHWSGPADWS